MLTSVGGMLTYLLTTTLLTLQFDGGKYIVYGGIYVCIHVGKGYVSCWGCACQFNKCIICAVMIGENEDNR